MVVWIRRCVPSKANKWIERRVSLINRSILIRKNRLDHFIATYLEPDGIFMIRMIANNTSDFVATDLIHNLWCQHADNYDRFFQDDPHTVDTTSCVFEHKIKDEKPRFDGNPPKNQSTSFNQEEELNRSNADTSQDYLSFGHIFNRLNSRDQDAINSMHAYSRFQSLLNQTGNSKVSKNVEFNLEKNQSRLVNDFNNDESSNLIENVNESTLQYRKRDSVPNIPSNANSTKV